MAIQTALDSISQNQGSPFGFKNRIINGGMVIDQRNAGANTTPTVSGQYNLDRFNIELSQSSKLKVGQNLNSVTPPPGFTKYLGITSLSSYSVLSGDYFILTQAIEGYNVADLDWGLTTASSVTLSFWVRSSLTGTFSGSIVNLDGSRGYGYTYTINSVNTWEKKIVTIPGDQTGSWNKDTAQGMRVRWNLGTGTTYSFAAGSWGSNTNVYGVTGSTSVVGTNAATWYITGVQLEKGNQSTSFDYRPYGTELMLCKRYLPIYNSTTASDVPIGTHSIFNTTTGVAQFMFEVESRVPPSGISVTGTIRATVPGNNTWNVTPTFSTATTKMCNLVISGTGLGTGFGTLLSGSLPAQIQFTGCEL